VDRRPRRLGNSEDAYDDFAVAQVAKALEGSGFPFFINARATTAILYNPARGFMQGRNADGSWAARRMAEPRRSVGLHVFRVSTILRGYGAMGGPENSMPGWMSTSRAGTTTR